MIMQPPTGDVQDLDADRALRASVHTSRHRALIQPVVAHIAFANNAALGIVLRHAVRTIPGAVLAANAEVRIKVHNPCEAILRISLHRAADEARRLETMIAAHGNVPALRVRINAAFDLADASPIEFRWVAILLVARHHAAFATDALRHIEVEAILLAFSNLPSGHERRHLWRRTRDPERTAVTGRLLHQRQLNRHAAPPHR